MKQSPILNEQGLYDLYGLWHTPWWQTRLFYGCVGFVFVAIVTYTILRLVYYYRIKARYKQPWEIALAELQALKQSRLQTLQDTKVCYERLCWILKKYLSARYNMPLEGKTEEEVITLFNTYAVMAPEHVHELQEIFQGGTLVKFANLTVMQDQIMHNLDRSMRIVIATRPADNI